MMALRDNGPLLDVDGLTQIYGQQIGCEDVKFSLYPGEVLGIVGESGSGKSTLLRCASGLMQPTAGSVRFNTRVDGLQEIHALSEAERRMLMRTDWGIIFQNARDGLRMNVSAGANVGERLMAVGGSHSWHHPRPLLEWLEKVEMDLSRMDDLPEPSPAACSSACRSPAILSRNRVWFSWMSNQRA